MIKPILDYCLGRKIEEDYGAVVGLDITETKQHFEILAVGEGRYEHGVLIVPQVKVGDIVWIQKHGEADTPEKLSNEGLYLFMASRIMAIEETR